MDSLNQKLELVFNDQTCPAIIRKAVQRGLIVLNKYYSLTDDSVMWKTAMRVLLSSFGYSLTDSFTVLHPGYRCHWFMKAQWEDSWTDQAVCEPRKIWTRYYKPLIKHATPPPPPSNDNDDLPSEDDEEPIATNVDPFKEFIMGSRTADDPIKFWWGRSAPPKSSTITPPQALACMALDFLSAPATSTDVEHLFSRSGLIVAKRRYSLAP